MSEHGKKKIAPIIVTIVVLFIYALYFYVIIITVPPFWRVLVGIIPLAIGGTTIYVCKQRLNEIDGGEEDDLSKY